MVVFFFTIPRNRRPVQKKLIIKFDIVQLLSNINIVFSSPFDSSYGIQLLLYYLSCFTLLSKSSTMLFSS